MSAFEVAAFYKFVPLASPEAYREQILESGKKHGACGTILLAPEGINGTIATPHGKLADFMAELRSHRPFADLEDKQSSATEAPFHRFKVRLKKEIVTMGEPDVDPLQQVGEYIDAERWNALIGDPETVLIDTRNDYEVRVGKFKGAINPNTDSFREFPQWAREHLPPDKQKPIAMYCTGGIRCEKATAFVQKLGYEKVFHLKGGILKYLETIPLEESTWEGSCFVFDGRVGVEQSLAESDIELCYGCREPLTAEQRQDPRYEAGVACPQCADSLSPERLASLRERHKQVQLAKARGTKHIGADHHSAPQCHVCGE
jgi:UPF0176 protein